MKSPINSISMAATLLAVCLLACTAGTRLVAQDNLFVNDAAPDTPASVRDAEPWREQQFALPPWPREENLIPVRLDSAGGPFSYFIDALSLNTGTDAVVRYTLVAQSASGVRNLSFEGVRCTPRGQFRVYAYGQQGRFEPVAQTDDWRSIDRTGSDPIREELWRHYLCIPRKFAPRPREAQLRTLRSGRVGKHENSGFRTD